MDDNKPATTPEPRPVMDIQPPRPVSPTANPTSTESLIGGAASSPAPTPVPVTEALSGTEPSTEQAPTTPTPEAEPAPAAPASFEPAPTPAEAPAEETPEANATNGGVVTPAAQTPHKKRHGAPIAAMIVAIVIALALIAVAVFAYMKSRDKKAPAPTTATTSPAVNSVSTADVDKANSSIDSNLKKVDEAKDFPTTDLSDASLSLQ